MASGTSRGSGTFLKFDNGESGISVGDAVALSKSTDNAVVRAQASDLDRMPAIGIVRKVNSSRVIVQIDSVYSWPDTSSVSITTGQDYWVSDTIGQLTNDSSTISSGMLQLFGVGKQSPRKILVLPDPVGTLL